MRRLLAPLILALFTAACVSGGSAVPKGDTGAEIATDALAAEVISAQPLDTPADPGNDALDAAPAPAAETVTEGASPPVADEVAAEPEPVVPEVLPDPEPKEPSSPEEAVCLKSGGLWIHAGKSIAFTCVKITRDSGKQCRRSSECQGSCLARSMTCAPYDPLFGCNEILQDDGVRVTLCID